MSVHNHSSWQQLLHSGVAKYSGDPTVEPQLIGHPHFWERALTRRRFLRTTGGTAAMVLTAGLWTPALAESVAAAPKPIPGGSPIIAGALDKQIHLYVPGVIDPPDAEPSTIFDFVGKVGLAAISGWGTTNTSERRPFEADMRFMQGTYMGVDGRQHTGTFAFI